MIVPTFREAANLRLLLPALHRVLSDAALDHEIVVVDDDSRDGTEALVAEFCASGAPLPVRLLVRRGERGLASAVVHGFRASRGEFLVCMDADLSHPPETVPELVAALRGADGADFVIGSRYVAGGGTDAEWGMFRAMNSRIATMLAWPLTSARDPMAGFFALRRERFEQVAGVINPIGYKIGLELLVRTRARRCVEIPIQFRDRQHGTSKLSMRQQLLYLRQLVQLMAWRARQPTQASRAG